MTSTVEENIERLLMWLINQPAPAHALTTNKAASSTTAMIFQIPPVTPTASVLRALIRIDKS
ncbi:hypothetical protein LXA47_25400 [Massilia sp. P8910]|uniref:hypothetical protein n=1 Tax=Massilia antarctica TaxID=2765360 RepID=UPI001E502989|nr:hypothetical protein [Massilia antarctica]MCE3606915.1 hypothetical protein [Massilia antarctica]